jgi:hypothetical protein
VAANYRDDIAVDVSTIRVFVDGVDVTILATTTESAMTYVPRERMATCFPLSAT